MASIQEAIAVGTLVTALLVIQLKRWQRKLKAATATLERETASVR